MVRLITTFLFILSFMTLSYAQGQTNVTSEVKSYTPSSVIINFVNISNSQIIFKPTVSINGVSLERDNLSMVTLKPNESIAINFRSSKPFNPDDYSLFKITVGTDCDNKNNGCQNTTIETSLKPITPLPVTLTSFTAQSKGMYNLLNWETASEINSESFEIQRSLDGKTFKEVAKISAAGNSSTRNSYSFNDYHTTSELTYYRLKQIDIDGRYTYTKTIVVKNNPEETKDYFGFKIKNNEIPSCLMLFSLNGKLNKEIKITDNEPVINLDKGVSIIVLITDKGRYSKKVIQQ